MGFIKTNDTVVSSDEQLPNIFKIYFVLVFTDVNTNTNTSLSKVR